MLAILEPGKEDELRRVLLKRLAAAVRRDGATVVACVARRTPVAAGAGSPRARRRCVSIVSALTPEMANRVDLVSGVLPPGVPDAARTLALALGLGLIWLSRGLARRKRRAWWLAVALVVASAVAHLAKGLDFEEATAAPDPARRALARAPAVRRAGRPGDDPAARPGRRGARASACRSSLVLRATTTTRTPSASRRRCCS